MYYYYYYYYYCGENLPRCQVLFTLKIIKSILECRLLQICFNEKQEKTQRVCKNINCIKIFKQLACRVNLKQVAFSNIVLFFLKKKTGFGISCNLHEMSESFSLDINDQYQSAFAEYMKEKETLIIKSIQVITKKS